jgi:hypothetical protein
MSNGSDGITVDPAALMVIANAAGDLQQRTLKDGMHAEDDTEAAARAFKNESFDLGGALAKALEAWESQIDTLALACTKIERSLGVAAGEYEKVDTANEMTMAEIGKNFE